MSWNEEKVNKLKELWGSGKTASQIAEIIGGISRNAVIGKAHRLNLSAKIKTRVSSSNFNSDNKISDTINIIAPEHLELSVDKYKSILKNVKNAGSICTGKYSAMAVTDYCAGSNHTLPTQSSEKFFSGLSFLIFLKKFHT